MFFGDSERIQIDKIIEVSQGIIKRDVSALNKVEFSSFDFENALAPLYDIQSMLTMLNRDSVSRIQPGVFGPISQDLAQIVDITTRAEDFNVRGNNPGAERDSIAKGLIESYRVLFQKLQPALTYSLLLQDDINIKLNELLSDGIKMKEELSSITTETTAKANSLLEDIKNMAADKVVDKYAGIFQEEAKKQGTESNTWFWITVGALAATIVYGLTLLLWPGFAIDGNTTIAQSIQIGISKLVVFSMLSYFVYLSNKNYRVRQHSSMVNTHRHNALRTFETFVEATNDSQTKDAVLIHAAQTIFSPQQTGYLSNEESNVGGMKVLEIIRGITNNTVA
jgi:hypothetical protein